MRLDWRPRGGRESPANVDLGRLRHEIAHPNQVVSGRREGEHPSDFVRPPEPRLALQGNCLHPAEDFLDTFSFSLADGVARLTRCNARRGSGGRTKSDGCSPSRRPLTTWFGCAISWRSLPKSPLAGDSRPPRGHQSSRMRLTPRANPAREP